DPFDEIGQALLRAGVISEEDLARIALGVAPLTQALVSLHKLTPEQCGQIFANMVRESLLDIFLWDSGSAEWMGGRVEGAESPFPLAIEVRPLCREGAKRRERWSSVRHLLPKPDQQLERAAPWPDGFPRDAVDRILAVQIDRGLSLREIEVELRGQRFAVGVKIGELIAAGAVCAVAGVGFVGSAPQEPSGEEK